MNARALARQVDGLGSGTGRHFPSSAWLRTVAN